MAIQRAEGFHHFDNFTFWAEKGHNGGGVNSSILPTGGRGGRGAALIGLNNRMGVVYKTQLITSYVHYAFYVTGRVAGQELGCFRNASISHLEILGDESGALSVYQATLPFATGLFLPPGRVFLGSTDPNVYRAGVWHHMQISATIDPTAGAVRILVDGIEVLNLTGINTYSGGAVSAVQYVVGSGLGSANHYYSDFVVVDEETTDANGNTTPYTGFMGDVSVYEYVNPIDGDLLEWARSSGAGTWSSHVTDNPPDGDTTFLSSGTPGLINTFLFPNVDTSTVGDVLAIKNTVYHRKDEPAFATIRLVSRSDDDVNHFSSITSVTETYKFDEIIHDVDPKDGVAWDDTRVNNTQLGIEHEA